MKSAFKERQLSDYSAMSQRPKRNASTKGLGCSNGLHWMEEKQLKKALYASLNETKKARLLDENTSEDSREQTPKAATNAVVASKPADSDAKRIKVHAQRKFAQGSNPSSPMPTPVKLVPPCRDPREPVGQPSTLLPCRRRPKTEDFLTFLCLRGTAALPPALDFMSGTAFPGSCSSSDRSSSPDLDAPVTSNGAESKASAMQGAPQESRVAQRATARGPKQDRRLPRPEAGEEKHGSEQRASRSATAARQKMDKRRSVPEKLKEAYSRLASTSRNHDRARVNLTALQEKYKQRRIAQQCAAPRKHSARTVAGGHTLRSRATQEAVQPPVRRAVKAVPVKPKEQLCNTTVSRHPAVTKEEDMAAKKRLVLKKQLSVQLTRLHPRIAASLRLPVAASAGSGVVTRQRSVGITPHLRKAKMVPPIVDYESESEKDSSPLSPPMSPVVTVRPKPRTTGGKSFNAAHKQRARARVTIPVRAKTKPASSVLARKLLSRATTRMRPRSAARKAARCAAFRRKTRSLGPVKEYPLVLALPTKRGSGRFSATAKKKAEELAVVKPAQSKVPLVRRVEPLPVLPKTSSAAAQQKIKKTELPVRNNSAAKRVSRRVSSEGGKDVRTLRRRCDATVLQTKRQPRKISLGSIDKVRKSAVAKRRRTEGCTSSSVHSRLFSDSDDEPLIKVAGRLSEKKVVSATEKDLSLRQHHSDSMQRTLCSTSPLPAPLSRKKATSAKDKNKLHGSDKSKLFKASLASERFSEPSPSSLSETIADAAGDPLDTRADFDDLESMSGGVEALDALAGEISQVMSCRLSFGSAQEIQSLMTSEFSGAFDENVTGTMLLGTRDGRSASFEGGLNLLKRDDTPCKIDASTSTSDEGIALLAISTPEQRVATPEEEASVATPMGIGDVDGPSSAAELQTLSTTIRRLSFAEPGTNCVAVERTDLETLKSPPSSPKSKSAVSPVQRAVSPPVLATRPDTRAGGASQTSSPESRPDPSLEISAKSASKPAHVAAPAHMPNTRLVAAKGTAEAKLALVSSAAKQSAVAAQVQRHGSLNPTLGSRASAARAPKAHPSKAAPSPKVAPTPKAAALPKASPSIDAAASPNATPVPRAAATSKAAPTPKAAPIPKGAPTPKVAPVPKVAPIHRAATLSKAAALPRMTPLPRVTSFSKVASFSKVTSLHRAGPAKRAKLSSDEPRRPKLTPLDSKKFPSESDPACLVAAPTYRPTAEEMRDPIGYISKIRPEAEKFGICRIVLPPSFQPECKVFDDMRFTAYNQYIHKMLSRWGPNVQHTACIKRCFTKQGITDDQPPLIGGIELDLSYLYRTVQNFGGIQQVMEKKKWHRVADAMHIPRAAQDRVSKVDDAYCKFVLPYDLLSADEKKAIEQEVLADRQRQLASESEPSSTSTDDDEEEQFTNECVAKVSRLFAGRASHGRMRQPPAWTDQSNTRKGRSMSLSVFSRVARNTMSMWYKQEPSTDEVERDYWNLVIDQRRHVCVHAGNIDSSVHGSGFPTNRLVPLSKHPWNLKVLTNNPGTILRCMGPVSGVTIPTLHLSMLYTTGCWYRDPHCLPWIEYLHTGANKIWYSVPAHSSERFRAAMKEIMPQVCKDSVIWLPSDCAMVPPPQLVDHGCPLSRLVQEKGQFVVIFPGAFTSTIACGYSVSESVYFATQDWLLQASECFEHMKASCEPPTFSFEKLLLGISRELRENLEACRWTLPLLENMCENEQRYRTQLVEMGLKTFERLPLEEAADPKKAKRPRLRPEDSNHECDFCRISCHVSMVVGLQDDTLYCLEHAVHCLQRKNMKGWKLLYTYDMDELRSILRKLKEHIESEEASQIKMDSDPSTPKKKVVKKKGV